MNARVLDACDDVALERVLGRYLGAADRIAARDRASVRTLALDGAREPEALAPAIAALPGLFAASNGPRVIAVGTFDAFDRARHDAGPALRDALDEIVRACDAVAMPPRSFRARGRTLALDFACVMGILNVTPDSFFDRGRYRGVDAARARAAEMVAAGAAIVDIGGRSYSSANPVVAADEERARVVPIVEALARDGLDAMLSIDTTQPIVAEAALAAGAHVINDCSGLADADLAHVAARAGAGFVVMHLRGALNVREAAYRYADALGEISSFLRDGLERALAAGVAPDAVLADPGLEFGKEGATDLEILGRFGELRSLGTPLVLAASRKSFLGALFERPAAGLLVPSLAAAAVGVLAGATVVRAHDIAETVDLIRTLEAARASA